MREGDLAAFSASTSGTTTPVDDGSADIGAQSGKTPSPKTASASPVADGCAATGA